MPCCASCFDESAIVPTAIGVLLMLRYSALHTREEREREKGRKSKYRKQEIPGRANDDRALLTNQKLAQGGGAFSGQNDSREHEVRPATDVPHEDRHVSRDNRQQSRYLPETVHCTSLRSSVRVDAARARARAHTHTQRIRKHKSID